MSLSTRDGVATRTLLARVEEGSTGCLRLGQSEAELSVYMLNGHIVAATRHDDDALLIDGFARQGALDDETRTMLEEKLSEGADTFGLLLDLGMPDMLDHLVAERFTQNLCDFVSADAPPTFRALPAIYTDSVQVGHDTRALLDEVCDACDRVKSLDSELLVVRGPADPGPDNPDGQVVADRLGPEAQRVGALLEAIPFESTRARLALTDLLERGVAVQAPVAVPWADAAEDEDHHEPSFSEDETDLGSQAREHTPPAIEDGGNGVPRSLEEWLADTTRATAQDDLEFFSDHDYDRGAGAAGAFRTEEHNLDKVEVGSIIDSPIPAPGATPRDVPHHAGFGAPVLSETDARGKIGVANDVLGAVARAFDSAEGAGRGRAALQLLVDGGPSQFAAVLQDVTLTEAGLLPVTPLLANLAGRPPAEHRRLLNDSLVDIIERALSNAADELPDEEVDQLLEGIAGFRQRLGL